MDGFSYNCLIEPRYKKFLKPQFDLTKNPTAEAYLIRLLTGTLNIVNDYSTDTFDQKLNYSVLGRSENILVSTKSITNCLQKPGAISRICSYIDAHGNINYNFYRLLLNELTCYFYKKSKGSHTTGFIHLYRSLEYISYSFPLIYSSASRDFYGSFNTLKKYFNDESQSEVTFFDEFLKKTLDASELDSTFELRFNTLSPDINSKHYNIVKQRLQPELITNDVPGVSITLNYKHLIKLAVDLRNRYFHFAVGGQRNIKGTDIVENDLFFDVINEELVNWLSVIYFSVLEQTVYKN